MNNEIKQIVLFRKQVAVRQDTPVEKSPGVAKRFNSIKKKILGSDTGKLLDAFNAAPTDKKKECLHKLILTILTKKDQSREAIEKTLNTYLTNVRETFEKHGKHEEYRLMLTDVIESDTIKTRINGMAVDRILASRTSSVRKSDSLQERYSSKSPSYVTPQIILTDRAAILKSDMRDSDKADALVALYKTGARYLTAELFTTESAAIKTSKMSKADDVVIGLFHAGGEYLSTAREEILASKTLNEDKHTSLAKLYGEKAIFLTEELMLTERIEILESTMNSSVKYLTLKALYTAGASHLTEELIPTERIAILESKMNNLDKALALDALYKAGASHLTEERIQTERIAISDSNMDSMHKTMALQDLRIAGLSRAGSVSLPPNGGPKF